MQLVDALRARKPHLAETKVYDNPPAGTRSIAAWTEDLGAGKHAGAAGFLEARVAFLDWNLDPFHGPLPPFDEVKYLAVGTDRAHAERPFCARKVELGRHSVSSFRRV